MRKSKWIFRTYSNLKLVGEVQIWGRNEVRPRSHILGKLDVLTVSS